MAFRKFSERQQHLPRERPKRAETPRHRYADDAREDVVIKRRRQAARRRLRLIHHGVDDVALLLAERGHESGDMLRLIFKVSIHQHDHIAGRMVDGRRNRRMLAKVSREADRLDPRIECRQARQFRPRPVAAAVVDEQHLVVMSRQRRAQCADTARRACARCCKRARAPKSGWRMSTSNEQAGGTNAAPPADSTRPARPAAARKSRASAAPAG